MTRGGALGCKRERSPTLRDCLPNWEEEGARCLSSTFGPPSEESHSSRDIVSDVDVVIAGGGIAGLTAGLFSARYGRSTVLCDFLVGGQLLNIGKIEDYPGFPNGVAGYELCPLIQEQVMDAGGQFHLTQVQSIAADGERWVVATDDGDLRARTVIIATGCRFKELDVPGAARLSGRGVSHCATCDGPLWRGQVVGVVGGGDSALQEALELAAYVDRVMIFHRGTEFSGQQAYQDRIAKHPSIEVRFGTVIEEVVGDETVCAVRVTDRSTGKAQSVDLSALFVYVGLEPQAGFLRDHTILDESGRVVTDEMMRTKLLGMLAAGSGRRGSQGQAAAVAGEGATAAMMAHRFLATGSWSSGGVPAREGARAR